MKIVILEKNSGQTWVFFTSLEIVDIFKNYDNIIIMKFTVEKLPQAKNEIDSLEQSQKDMLEADYKKKYKNKELNLFV